MVLRHFVTFDVPLKLEEEELLDHLANLLWFCLKNGYITEEDARTRLVSFGAVFDENLATFGFYIKVDPLARDKESAKAEKSPQNQNQGDSTDPPFGKEPTPFNPDALRDVVKQQLSLIKAIKRPERSESDATDAPTRDS